jgi:hypothetical protein
MIKLENISVLIMMFLGALNAFGYQDSFENAQRLRRAIEIQRPFEPAGGQFLNAPAEKLVLPVSRGFSQGGTQLCWVYSFFNALESNYLVRNPNKTLELSRGAMQVMTLEDRFIRWINSGEDYLSERGDEIDAWAIVKEKGLLSFADYQDRIDYSNSAYSTIRNAVNRVTTTADKLSALKAGIVSNFPEIPKTTTFEGHAVELMVMARNIVGTDEWISYAPTTGPEQWGPNPDPDARKGSLVYFMSKDKIINQIKVSLSLGHAVTYGTEGHATLIYGAEYDDQGNPTIYYIKDSYPNYFYKANAELLHDNLAEITTIK